MWWIDRLSELHIQNFHVIKDLKRIEKKKIVPLAKEEPFCQKKRLKTVPHWSWNSTSLTQWYRFHETVPARSQNSSISEKKGPFSKRLHFWYGGTIFLPFLGGETAPQRSQDSSTFGKVEPFSTFFWKTAPLWSLFGKWYHFGQRHLFFTQTGL